MRARVLLFQLLAVVAILLATASASARVETQTRVRAIDSMLATCIELEAGRTLEHRPANRFDGPTNAADSCVAAEAAPLELTTAARPTLMSRATSFLRALHLDQRGSLRLPGQARTTYDAAEAFRRLEKFNGISPALASERLHGIKQAAGLGGADNVIFDLSGGVYHPETLEFLGTMTEGGAAGGVP